MNFPPIETDDHHLVKLTAEGDTAAFTELYDRHATLVFSIALRILADREEARDVLQQVFLKLHRKASLYSPHKGKPAAWLAALARNQALDRLRQIRSNRVLGEKLYQYTVAAEAMIAPVESYARYTDEVDFLHDALSALRPDERNVLALAYFGGLSQTEISAKLDQPLGSIKARIRRSLMKLRAALEGIIEQHPASPEGQPINATILPV